MKNIFVLSEQTDVPVDLRAIEKNTASIIAHLGYPTFDISIIFVDLESMHAYNKQFRNKNKPTDILSFPFHADLKPGETITAISRDEKNLGDIIICPEYVRNDLERWDQSFDERMKVLLVHGICHLLGYDHIEDEDYEVMNKVEQELLTIINDN